MKLNNLATKLLNKLGILHYDCEVDDVEECSEEKTITVIEKHHITITPRVNVNVNKVKEVLEKEGFTLVGDWDHEYDYTKLLKEKTTKKYRTISSIDVRVEYDDMQRLRSITIYKTIRVERL